MITADAANRQLAATSQYRARPVLEWSKQLSRSVTPYFLSSPMPNIRQSYGAESPHRHMAQIVFDKARGKDDAPRVEDTRDYTPMRYEELHHHCGVSIGRTLPRKNFFAAGSGSESCLDPFQHPGWVKKGNSTFATQERDTSASMIHSSVHNVSKSPNASTVIDVSKTDRALDLTKHHGPAFQFPKAARSTSVTPIDHRDGLNVSTTAVYRHTPASSIARSSSRQRDPKPSEGYRDILIAPAVIAKGPQKLRMTNGFAPMRYNHRLTLADILNQAETDIKRSHSAMESLFGERSRSELRTTLLYTPPPS